MKTNVKDKAREIDQQLKDEELAKLDQRSIHGEHGKKALTKRDERSIQENEDMRLALKLQDDEDRLARQKQSSTLRDTDLEASRLEQLMLKERTLAEEQASLALIEQMRREEIQNRILAEEQASLALIEQMRREEIQNIILAEEQASLALIEQISREEASKKPSKTAEKTYNNLFEFLNAISEEFFDNSKYANLTKDEKVFVLNLAREQAENNIAEVVGLEGEKILNLLEKLKEKPDELIQSASGNTSPRSHSKLVQSKQRDGKSLK